MNLNKYNIKQLDTLFNISGRDAFHNKHHTRVIYDDISKEIAFRCYQYELKIGDNVNIDTSKYIILQVNPNNPNGIVICKVKVQF